MGRWDRFKELLKKVNKNEGMPVVQNAWCGIFRDTDNPCEERAVCLMRYSDQGGVAKALFLCDYHHPDKNSWTRRHFEIKGCRIISVEALPNSPAS